MRKDSLSSNGLNATILEILQTREGTSPPLPPAGGTGEDSREQTGMTRAHLRRALKASGVVVREEQGSQAGADVSRLRVPGYRVISRIGEGGSATVFLAERMEDHLVVVLKVVFTAACKRDPNLLRRFMQEYELIEEIQHKNVVRIHERAFAKDYAYISM